MISQLILSMRPKQWTKNLVIFAALIFSKHLTNPDYLEKSVIAFFLFCMLSGSVYIINDILDIEKDRKHPRKCKRPLPSGKVSVSSALIFSLVLTVGTFILSFTILGRYFFLISLLYYLLIVLYSTFLKHIVIVDVISIALGFVLRAVAGVYAIRVYFSPWLLVCTLLLALFLAIAKRRNELTVFEGSAQAAGHRKVLSEYSIQLLDQMIAVVTASTVIAYSLYTFDKRTISTFNTDRLSLTIPFVIYGIYRYLYLIHKRGLGGSPEMVLLTDRGIIVNTILWILTVGLIIYSGRLSAIF
jgi:4-hydroxybenzoate polyprenyltransferase